MTATGTQLRSLTRFAVMAVATGCVVMLTSKANGVKRDLRTAEHQMLALESENRALTLEFDTRAAHLRLTQVNAQEFGYQAPAPLQYVVGDRQLALLGRPRAADAPPPIRMASAEGDDSPEMVSPLTGRVIGAGLVERAGAAEAPAHPGHRPVSAATLRARLSEVDGPPAHVTRAALVTR
jgi:hypothetical protein